MYINCFEKDLSNEYFAGYFSVLRRKMFVRLNYEIEHHHREYLITQLLCFTYLPTVLMNIIRFFPDL